MTKEELDFTIEVLSELVELPIFQRNDAREYTALVLALEELSGKKLDKDEEVEEEKVEETHCSYFESRVNKMPSFENGVLVMKDIESGFCRRFNTQVDCQGKNDKCVMKG